VLASGFGRRLRPLIDDWWLRLPIMTTSTSESFVFSNNLEAPRKSLPGRTRMFLGVLAGG